MMVATATLLIDSIGREYRELSIGAAHTHCKCGTTLAAMIYFQRM